MQSKTEIITEILGNSVYQPNSGMRESLVRGLEKLSFNDIQALKLIIEIKVSDARKAAAAECGKFSKVLFGGGK